VPGGDLLFFQRRAGPPLFAQSIPRKNIEKSENREMIIGRQRGALAFPDHTRARELRIYGKLGNPGYSGIMKREKPCEALDWPEIMRLASLVRSTPIGQRPVAQHWGNSYGRK
jgi:hypothetical protein